MLEFLRSIPGPVFLWVYPGVSLLLLGVGLITRSLLDNTINSPMPDLAEPDADAVAYLSNGMTGLIKAITFRLWRRGAIDLETDGKDFRVVSTEEELSSANSSPLDHIVFSYIQDYYSQISPRTLVNSSSLRDQLGKAFAEKRLALVRAKLVPAIFQVYVMFGNIVVIMLLSLAFGGVKMGLGIANDRPFAFLFVEMCIAMVVYPIILWPNKFRTRLGGEYVRRLSGHFEWLCREPDGTFSALGVMDPALPFVLYGAGSFSGHPECSSFAQFFHCAPTCKLHSWDAGCGGCSGCADGSGCGGSGGGCGGGCGGCGD